MVPKKRVFQFCFEGGGTQWGVWGARRASAEIRHLPFTSPKQPTWKNPQHNKGCTKVNEMKLFPITDGHVTAGAFLFFL